jgi:hypothetical protein
MMTVEGTFEHADDAIRLPYGDGDLRFVAMMDPRAEPPAAPDGAAAAAGDPVAAPSGGAAAAAGDPVAAPSGGAAAAARDPVAAPSGGAAAAARDPVAAPAGGAAAAARDPVTAPSGGAAVPAGDAMAAPRSAGIAAGDPESAAGDAIAAPRSAGIAAGDPKSAAGDAMAAPRSGGIAAGDPEPAAGDAMAAPRSAGIAAGDPRSAAGDAVGAAVAARDWRAVSWSRGRGTVVMPVFGAESRHELGDALRELGLGPAFVPGGDLEDLFRGPGEKALGRILQRARVDVDELGTRAAAVTVVTARAVSAVLGPPPFHLTFDRPFTWAIEHAPTATLLFVGRVRHPTERSH